MLPCVGENARNVAPHALMDISDESRFTPFRSDGRARGRLIHNAIMMWGEIDLTVNLHCKSININ